MYTFRGIIEMCLKKYVPPTSDLTKNKLTKIKLGVEIIKRNLTGKLQVSLFLIKSHFSSKHKYFLCSN